uniref:DUF4766 domain-containing protein n=1 Tax=Cuerna arida TaxID=1464854 RepID=A0A1B6F2P3_9HEMI
MKIFGVLALLIVLHVSTSWGQNSGPRNMGSGRRGDILNMGDVDEQIAFNIDNTGGSGGGGSVGGGGSGGGDAGGSGGGGGLKAPQDCAMIMKVCQCDGGGTKGGGTKGGSKGGQRPISGQSDDPPDYAINN